jgi:hypothetical protein
MALSWSDPNPSQATAATLGNAARIEDINIGPIVASIMKFRQEQAQQQAAAQQQMYAGIAKGVGAYQANAKEGEANDAANATMYGIQNPNDPYGGFSNPDNVPDYGGTDALRALESAKSMGGFQDPQAKALESAKLDLVNAQAHRTWIDDPNGGNSSVNDLNDFRKQQIINEADMNRARKTLEESLGVTGKDADAALAALSGYKSGAGAFPAIGDHPAIGDASEGDYKDRSLAAAKAYRDAMSSIQGRPPMTGLGGNNTTYTPGQGNTRMEGGRETATGAPMHYLEDGNATLAVNPMDKALLGSHGMLTLADGTQIPADVSDTGPGVRRGNFDIASRNSALAYDTPKILAAARYTPSNGAAQPGVEPTPAPGSPETQPGDFSRATTAIAEQLRNSQYPAAQAAPGSTPPAQPTPPPVQVTSKQEYDQLPSGSTFIGPDGKTWVKP